MTVKILAIGNSFSEDATYFVHDLATANQVATHVVNLYVPGCSLHQHWEHFQQQAMVYRYELNGRITERYVSIQAALMETNWDVIVLQQASHDSGKWETYWPFARDLIDAIRIICPESKYWLHQTWAYEIDSQHPGFTGYQANQMYMYQASSDCYRRLAKELSLGLIPTGQVIQQLRTTIPFDYSRGGASLCRDGYHLDYLYGRYAAAATWVACLCGVNLHQSIYQPYRHDVPKQSADPALIELINTLVMQVSLQQ